MVAYDEVIKIIRDNEFISWCCKLSSDFELIKTDWGTHHLKLKDDTHFFSTYNYNDILIKKPNIIILEALFYQARIGWNNRKKDMLINLNSDSIEIFFLNFKEIAKHLYNNFESSKPISQEVQALITGLIYCYKMEIAKNKLDQISTKNIPDDFQEIINNNFDELTGK